MAALTLSLAASLMARVHHACHVFFSKLTYLLTYLLTFLFVVLLLLRATPVTYGGR